VFEEMERALLANAHKHDRMNIDLKSRLDGKGKRQGKEHDYQVTSRPTEICSITHNSAWAAAGLGAACHRDRGEHLPWHQKLFPDPGRPHGGDGAAEVLVPAVRGRAQLHCTSTGKVRLALTQCSYYDRRCRSVKFWKRGDLQMEAGEDQRLHNKLKVGERCALRTRGQRLRSQWAPGPWPQKLMPPAVVACLPTFLHAA
jgi:hypothetical protein